MTQITAPTPTTATATAPDTSVALPGQVPLQQPATGLRPPGGRDGPLRSGNPRGNPNLAPRCGAKARTTGLACRAPAMANGRCRMHGGKCTGPRTPEGLARLAAARTTHGDHGAATRAIYRYRRTVIVRSRLLAAACQLQACLPPDIAARVVAGADDLAAPPRPFAGPMAKDPDKMTYNVVPGTLARDARGRFAARARRVKRGRMAEREAARIEAAMLAPWREGIARARIASRAARRAARGQNAKQGLPPGVCPDGGAARPDGVAAGLRSVPGLRPGGTLGQGARREERGQDVIQRGTVLRPTGPDRAAGARFDKNPIQPGDGGGTAPEMAATSSPAPPARRDLDPLCAAQARQRGRDGSGQNALQRGAVRSGAVRFGEWPFRRGLLDSTVGNAPAAHKLAAQVERRGGWTVQMAIEAAHQAGRDWRPGAAEARRRMAEEANRLRARCILRVGSVADVVRWDDLAGDGR